MNLKAKTMLLVATGCRVGDIPVAPGTFGSIEGLIFCWLLARSALPVALVLMLAFIALAIWVSHEAERTIGRKDPGCVVIDEVAGMMVTLLGLPFTYATAGIGFLLFRVLDILKPFPIRNLQDGLPGGFGIVMDDVAAGVFANLILRFLISVTGLT
jgi:phosphatidylglycerophosphatase A